MEYANQGEEKSLERFLEGIADTGRRGTKEALRVLFRLLNEDLVHRLYVADERQINAKFHGSNLKKEQFLHFYSFIMMSCLSIAISNEPIHHH